MYGMAFICGEWKGWEDTTSTSLGWMDCTNFFFLLGLDTNTTADLIREERVSEESQRPVSVRAHCSFSFFLIYLDTSCSIAFTPRPCCRPCPGLDLLLSGTSILGAVCSLDNLHILPLTSSLPSNADFFPSSCIFEACRARCMARFSPEPRLVPNRLLRIPLQTDQPRRLPRTR